MVKDSNQFMKVISVVNKHVAIWSFLRGDHALRNEIKLISPKLLEEPDFLSPLENKLRLEVFKHKRNWIYEHMGDNASFALAKISIKEMKDFITCFSEINVEQYYKKHKKAYKKKSDFLIERSKTKSNIRKSFYDIKKEHKLKNKLLKINKKINVKDVLDYKQFNEENLLLAANRCWIMKYNEKKIIVDGNHRLTAYYWAKQTKNNTLSNNLFCFYFEKNRQ